MLIAAHTIPDVTALITGTDYYRPAHETIHDAIVALAQAGKPVDPVLVAEELQRRGELQRVGGAPYLHTLTANVPTAANATYYAETVRDKARLRAVIDAGNRLVQHGYNGTPDTLDTTLGDALQAVEDAALRYTIGSGPTHWAALNLDAVLAGQEIDPPPALLARDDGQLLLYEGAVHSLSGEPGSGKTWVALIACAQQLIEGQTVTMVDFEDRASRVVGRLMALGVHPDTIRTHFRYVRPHTALDHTSRPDLEHAVHGARLVILDGVTEAMTLHGLDLNGNADVAAFYALLPRWIADQGPAVVMIDHVVKDGEKQGRWALGGQHKLAGLDGVGYLVKAIEPFGRGKTGHARITVSKDRPGYVEEIALGRTVAELWLDATDINCLRYQLRAPTEVPTDQAGNMRPTHLMERVSRYIEITPGLGKNELVDGRISGTGAYLKRAIDRLVQEGYIEVETGPNRKQIHRSVTPYREDEDAMHVNPEWARQEPLS